MSYRWFIMARVLHLLAIVVWIGGIAVITTVMFPAMHRLESNQQKIWLFQQIERRFRPQARIAWLIVGLTGFYMVGSLNGWARFTDPRFWWMDAMVALWVIFGLLLFVMEPLVVGPRLERRLKAHATGALARIQAMHWILLVLSLLVVAAGVAGVHGWF